MKRPRWRVEASLGSSDGKLSWPREPLILLLALLIFFTIGRAHQHYAVIGSLSPALILFVAAVGVAILKPQTIAVGNLRRCWVPKAVLSLGVLACLSVLFAEWVGTSGSFLVNSYAKILITFFLLVVAIRRPDHLYVFVWSYVLACGFLVWISLFYFQLSSTGTLFRLDSLYMYDANDMGLVLVTGLPLCIALFHSSGRVGRVASAVVLIGIGASLAHSGSRGGFLGLLAVGLALLLLLKHVSILKRLAFVGVVAAGLVVMAPEGYWDQMNSLTEPTEDYNWSSDYGRRKIAQRGVRYMMERPLTGLGVGNFTRAEGEISEVSRYRASLNLPYRYKASHNSFIQAGAEMGIPGLVLFSSLVFGSMIGMIRLRRRIPAWWRKSDGHRRFLWNLALYLPVSLIGFAVSGFFVSFAYMDVIYVLCAFVTGVYLMSARILRDDRDSSGQVPQATAGADRQGAPLFPARSPVGAE